MSVRKKICRTSIYKLLKKLKKDLSDLHRLNLYVRSKTFEGLSYFAKYAQTLFPEFTLISLDFFRQCMLQVYVCIIKKTLALSKINVLFYCNIHVYFLFTIFRLCPLLFLVFSLNEYKAKTRRNLFSIITCFDFNAIFIKWYKY